MTETSADACTYVPDGTGGDVELPPAVARRSPATVDVTIATSIGEFNLALDGERRRARPTRSSPLVEQGFYDGTTCHRMTVSAGFEVLQCGDPTGTGGGGPGYTIPAEYDGTETYPAGTLAMARAAIPTAAARSSSSASARPCSPRSTRCSGPSTRRPSTPSRSAAKAGVTPVMGPEDGTPKTEITFETATVD